jgi:amidohydrolase
MPINNRIADMTDEIVAWRRDIHENPELLYDVHRTAGVVAEKLASFGCDEVVPGIGKTGVVAVIKGREQTSGKVVGMRADMDALPIMEATGVPYTSKIPGKMHACGHDGHTASLLGAAKYLAETRNFNGTAVLVFQPAEEGGLGAKAMIDDGMMDRWGVQEVYGMHNAPGLPVGYFATRPGSLMAAADMITITIEGKGGHAAKPELAVDPILIGAQIVVAMQSVVARNVDPLESAVISLCTFNAGTAGNVIPASAVLTGSARSLTVAVQDLLQKRLTEIAETTAAMMGGKATVEYIRACPPTINHERQTAVAAEVAIQVAGKERVNANTVPVMGAEDFSFMLQSRPGAFVFFGNGNSSPVHHPGYNFNDEAIPHAVSFWAKLAETTMPR